MAARLLPLAITLLAGLAQAAAVAEPWSGQPLWWLQLASLAVLAWQVRRQASWRGAALQGWVFATAWLAATFWWLFISMHTYGGLPAPLAALAVLALAAFLASYYAAACAAWHRLAPAGRAGAALVFGGAWLLAELMRGVWFTGFPWGAAGYAHVDGPLAMLAPWLGVYGIGFAAAAMAWWLSLLAQASRRAVVPVLAGVAAPLAALALWAGTGGSPASQSAGRLPVTLLQGNIPQEEKFQGATGVPLALDWYAQRLREARGALVVAPETALPLLPQQLPEGYLGALGARFHDGGQAALIGMPLGNLQEGYTNSAVGLVPGGTLYRFDKHHLVPFGEFIPPLFRWFTDMMNIPLGDFNRGGVGQPSLAWQGQQLAPNICYEDLFGEELGARFADPARAPTVFVNMSNIGWFGNTVAIDQHLHISRMRALEFERPVIRATNTGATAIVDHRGRVATALPRHTRGVLEGEVEGRNGLTFFARWVSRLGLWPYWALGAGLLALALAAASRRRARLVLRRAEAP